MADLSKPLSESLSGISQVDMTPEMKEEEKEVESKPKKSKTFLIVVIILLVLILGMGGYYVYTQYFKGVEEEVVDVVQEDLTEQESENIEEQEVEEITVSPSSDSEEYIMKNTGWALFSLPEYGFSAEIPSYTMEQSVQEVNVKWSWTSKLEEYDNGLYPNYLTTAFLSFYPDITDVFGCGGGCAQEHMITIRVYENSGAKSLEEVKEMYFENVKDDGENNDYIPTISQLQEQKWGESVITFTQSVPADFNEYDGHIVVNNEYVYIIQYYRSETPIESYEISEKVLESFEFSK